MSMNLSPVFLHQFRDQVQRVLHVRGNFTDPVLEMTLVTDHSVDRAQMAEAVPALLRALKQQGDVFRNVRFNLADWLEDDRMENRVIPMMTVMVNGFFDTYRQLPGEKRIECLYQYLKFYHARSKLILLVTDGKYCLKEEEAAREACKPFLGKKLIRIMISEDGMELG